MKKYLTKPLLYNILIAIGLTFVLLMLVNWGLRIYTRHGQTLAVPDIKGLKFDAATDTLAKYHLDYEVMDSAYMTDKPPLSIIEQSPKPGTSVKSGRTIYLTINALGAPLAEIPDLIGKSSFKYAKIQLEGIGFKVGEPMYKPDPHRDALIGMLVDGRPLKAGTRIPKGTTITLLVGQGLANTSIPVPYVIGLPFEEAATKLREEFNLSIGAVTMSEGMTEADKARAFVYKQSPTFRSGRIHLGEEVDLWLAKEMPEDIVVHPEWYNSTEEVDSTSK
ncbi:MAG: domain containing protein [Bacteroidetes bacterium]|nr:domain containing protein [Bacteroidota bacterium]